jgi:hypothetical protein
MGNLYYLRVGKGERLHAGVDRQEAELWAGSSGESKAGPRELGGRTPRLFK